MPYDQYSLSFKFGSVLTFPDFDHVLDTIYKGDTLYLKKTIEFDYVGSGATRFCADVAIFSSPGWDSVKWETDSMREDNRFCYNGEHYDTSGSVGIQQFQQSDIAVFPNPTTGKVRVSGFHDELKIYNGMGEKLPIQVSHDLHQLEVDLSGYPDGLYLLTGSGFTLKVIKRH